MSTRRVSMVQVTFRFFHYVGQVSSELADDFAKCSNLIGVDLTLRPTIARVSPDLWRYSASTTPIL